MIVDASALIAILSGEPMAPLCAGALETADHARISAANWLEAAIVIDSRKDPIASRKFDQLVNEANLSIEPVTEVQVKIARDAYRDFGKGRGHPAQLNLGDCFASALAKDRGEALLFTGKHFSQTDMKSALE